MATIQIRGIPEDAYEVIRRRARAQGRSIQSYMLEHIVEFASRPTKAEVLADWDRRMRERGSYPGVSSEEIVADIHAGRRERQEAIEVAPDRDG